MYQSLLKFNLKKLGILKSHSGYTCHFVDLSILTTALGKKMAFQSTLGYF